jgi:hypothetical protein
MAMLAAIGPLISGIASIGGAVISAGAMGAQADAEEAMAKWNADRQREQAALAQSKGAIEAAEKEKQGRRQAAVARATFAQSGAQTDTGTPLLLEQEFASETAWKSNLAVANATIEQRNLLNKANAQEYEGSVRANASRASGTAALLSGFAGGAKSLSSVNFG